MTVPVREILRTPYDFIRSPRRTIEMARVGWWAGAEGWRTTNERCSQCGSRIARRDGDYACTQELVYRWERRSS